MSFYFSFISRAGEEVFGLESRARSREGEGNEKDVKRENSLALLALAREAKREEKKEKLARASRARTKRTRKNSLALLALTR